MRQLDFDRETDSKRGRKPAGKTKATKKGVDTYIESMKSGPLTHEKRKKRGHPFHCHSVHILSPSRLTLSTATPFT
jgi:hypothetical protein